MIHDRQPSPGIDIVIPVYHEGEGIRPVFEALARAVRTPFRVLVCYDLDDDSTLPVVRAFAESGFPVLAVRNTGHGAHGAVMSGFRASTAEAVVMVPADDDYNAALIDRMYAAFRDGAEIVCASRFSAGGCMHGCPWLKATLVRTSAFALYWFGRLPSRDASNGFRLFSRRVLTTVRIDSSVGFTYSIELLAKCHRLGWKIVDVPASWHERRTGSSRFRVLGWLPAYLRWFIYVFSTTWLRRDPATVPRTNNSADGAEATC